MEKGKLKGIFVSGNIPFGDEYKEAMQDVLHAFPYFQLAQVLYAKQLYDSNEPEASVRIKLASVYAPDRKAMYNLFRKVPERVESLKLTRAAEESIKSQLKGEIKYNFVYSSTKVDTEEIIPPKLKKESPKDSLSETFLRKELEAKPLLSSPPEKTEKVNEPPVTPAKKPYVKPVIEKKRSLYAKRPELPILKPIVTAKPQIIEVTPNTEEIKPESPTIWVEKENAPVKPDVASIEDKKTGIEPVSIAIPSLKESKIPTEPIEDNNLKYSFNDWLKVLPEISLEKKQEAKPLTQNETSGIIEEFLKKAPTISRPKAEFFSPVKAAKISITEDDDLVSETLARIFFEQGSLNKALKAYQTLLVRFPEKKNIFAPRIEEIKALIHDNNKPKAK